MVPLLQAIQAGQSRHGIAMERFYLFASITRQGFFQARHRQLCEENVWQEIALLVKTYRTKTDRRAGSRTLYHNLGIKARFNIGVSKFEELMSENGLSLAPLRVRVVTTQSSMQSWNYPNLTNGLVVNDINEVVVGDLTYVVIGKNRYFLFCLTDLYSARIVGYSLGNRMRAEDAKIAMDRWINLRGESNLKGCIHHTDGGAQYFSGLYLAESKRINLRVSCAENCLMNGYAEQRNGLIKHHLLPTVTHTEGKQLDREISRIMEVYNSERKQQALGWLSPVEFEKKISELKQRPEMVLYQFNKH